MNSLIRVGACDACGVKEWSFTALASVNQRVAVARKTVDLPTSKGKSYLAGWRGTGAAGNVFKLRIGTHCV